MRWFLILALALVGCSEADVGHCGCGAKSCEMPCSSCCSPGTCSMTQTPSTR